MLLNWTPNWTDTRLKGKFVKFPTYQPACETDPSWGINKQLLKDCANPSNGWLKKAAWPGLEKYSPCVFQLAKNINLNTEMIADASALYVIEKLSEDQMASHVLAGTLIYRSDAVVVNTRVINAHTKKIVASSRKLIPLYVLNKEDIYLSSN